MNPSPSARRLALAFLSIVAACGGAKEGATTVAGDLAIVGATVISGNDGTPERDRTIVIAGDSIVAIDTASAIAPHVKTTIDGRGKFVIPGLWDMHVHFAQWNEEALPLFVANGVTTVRSMGDELSFLLAWRDSAAKGGALLPTMLIAGPTLDDEYVSRTVAGTPMAPGRWIVSDSVSGVRSVDSLAALGVDHLKVHGMTPRDAYAGIIAEAKVKGLAVVGHTPDHRLPSEAIDAGQRTIEHNSEVELEQTPRGQAIHEWMYGAMRPIMNAERKKSRPSVGPIFLLRLAAADSAMASFDDATAAAFAAKVAKLPVWFDPTMVVMEAVYRGREPGVLDTMPLRYVTKKARGFDDGGGEAMPPATEEEIALGRKRWEGALRSVGALAKGGAKIITGTDVPVSPLVPGFSLHRELQHLVTAGLSPLQALQAATRNAADAAGKLAQVGTIERGKKADLVVLDADPLAAISNTTKIAAVVRHGRLSTRATLDSVLTAAEGRAK